MRSGTVVGGTANSDSVDDGPIDSPSQVSVPLRWIPRWAAGSPESCTVPAVTVPANARMLPTVPVPAKVPPVTRTGQVGLWPRTSTTPPVTWNCVLRSFPVAYQVPGPDQTTSLQALDESVPEYE